MTTTLHQHASTPSSSGSALNNNNNNNFLSTSTTTSPTATSTHPPFLLSTSSISSPPSSFRPNTPMSPLNRQGSGSEDQADISSTNGSEYNYSIPFAINCRLSKTFFGMPRKCCRCEKMIMLCAGYACQFCSFRCHRKCAADDDQYPSSSSSSMISANESASQLNSPVSPPSGPRKRRCSLSRLPAGDDQLFHKILQKTESSNCDPKSLNLLPDIYPEQWWTTPSGACSPSYTTEHQGGVGHAKGSTTDTALSSSGCGGSIAEADEICLYSSSCESVQTLTSADEHASSPADFKQPKAKARRPFFTNAEFRRTRDVAPEEEADSACAVDTSDEPNDETSDAPEINEGDSSVLTEEQGVMSRLFKLWPWSATSNTHDANTNKLINAYVNSPVDSFNQQVLERMYHKQSIGGCSSVATSASFADSAISSTCFDNNNRLTVNARRLNWVRFVAGDRGAHSQDCGVSTSEDYLASTPSIITQIRNKSYESEDVAYMNVASRAALRHHRHDHDRQHMRLRSSTWPLSGLHINYEEPALGTDDPPTSATDDGNQADVEDEGREELPFKKHLPSGQSESFRDLGEWSIPFTDLNFGDCLFKGRSVETYRGRWHGEVLIHTYDHTHLERFLRDVHTLTKIRHENIALFMGACMEPPNLAVVTSIRKRERLFDAIYQRKRPLDMSQKLLIARQIAQGIGYLHAKGIVLRCLTSKSIFLDGKVKICTVDYGGPAIASCNSTRRVHGGSILCRHQLSCMSPEIIRSLRLDVSNVKVDVRMHSKQSDIYAFGSVLFEMMSSGHAFSDMPADTIIYTIGHGNHESVEKLSCSVTIKSLIEDCWAGDASYRPVVSDILAAIITESTMRITKRQSSSEPEQLNRLGVVSKRNSQADHQAMLPYMMNQSYLAHVMQSDHR